MRKIYGKRHSALVEAIERYLPTQLKLIGTDAGLDRAARIITEHSDTVLARRIRELGIHVQALSINSIKKSIEHNGLVFGFGCGTPEEIRAKIRKISSLF